MDVEKTTTRSSKQAYDELFAQSRKARTLLGVIHHLDWDHQTFIPHGAEDFRAEQVRTLWGYYHQHKTSSDYKNNLEKLISLDTGEYLADDLSEEQKAALREWRRDFLRESVLPLDFIEDFAQTCTEAISVWREARKNNDFSAFSPWLKKIIELNRKKAEWIGYKEHPYDALLDEYEPGLTTAQVDRFFSKLYKGVRPLLDRIVDAPPIDNAFLFGDFAHEKQIESGKRLLSIMGFDWNRGRLDISVHPFCSASHPTDARITSRIHPDGLMSYLLSVLHEGGHALYEQNLPSEQYGSPLGDAISMGMHEANSRWWETRIGLSHPFWEYNYPSLQATYPDAFEDISLNRFYAAINKVSPSMIRVEADEVTYPLHIILRYQLEKQLIEGSLEVDLLPAAWEEKMKELLDIEPKDHKEGCLQDIHWSLGVFGYFPTYTLGTLFASSLFTQFVKDHPSWKEGVANGKMLFIKRWLETNIHQYGRRYHSLELIEKVTGKPFSIHPFLDYLNEKYSEIYDL